MTVTETNSSPRVISMVPSWTETLLESGINVVGRTRFCIHPRSRVAQIPIVGGTKDIQWEQVEALKPDILLLDREENTAEMAQATFGKTLVTHVENLSSMPEQLAILEQAIPSQAQSLSKLRDRYHRLLSQPKARWNQLPPVIPGEIQSVRRDFQDYENIVYVIWKNPWMSVAPQTFIGSVLQYLGAESFLISSPEKYPEFELEKQDLRKTFFLFSSEPFPFRKKLSELHSLGVQGCVVDGESYSWFGVRSLRFLEAMSAR